MEKPKLIQGGAQETKSTVENKKADQPKAEVKPAEKVIKPTIQGITQREAVYSEVLRVVREEKIAMVEKQPLKPLLTESQIKKICLALVVGFQTKKIALKETEGNKKKLGDTKLMELYCLGLVNNWLRRDPRLNGTAHSKK